MGSLCTLVEFEGQSAVSNPIKAMNRKNQQALASSHRAAFPGERGVERGAEPPDRAFEDLFRAMMSVISVSGGGSGEKQRAWNAQKSSVPLGFPSNSLRIPRNGVLGP